MSYIGETPVKKFARLRYWQETQKLCGSSFLTLPHVFLASEHAGDASVLHGMGVPWENMIAVDLDAKACQAASRRWPKLRVEHDEIDRFAARWRGMHPVSVYLDFCAPFCGPVEGVIEAVAYSWCASKAVGINLLKGRESRKKDRQALRARDFEAKDGWSSVAVYDMTEGQRSIEDRARLAALKRCLLALLPLSRAAERTGVGHFNPVRVFNYQTVSPMACSVFGLFPGRAPAVTEFGGLITEWISPRQAASVKAWAIHNTFGPHTAELLNIDRRQAAAWKAHATRGTYDAAPDSRAA